MHSGLELGMFFRRRYFFIIIIVIIIMTLDYGTDYKAGLKYGIDLRGQVLNSASNFGLGPK